MLPIRDDQPRYSTPWVNCFLIGLNLVIFFFEFDARSAEPGAADSAVWRGAVASGGVSRGVAQISAAGDRASLLHVDVSARRRGCT